MNDTKAIPDPNDFARMTHQAVLACNHAAEQLRGMGAAAISKAEAFNMQCNELADEFSRRSDTIAGNVRAFAQQVYDQAAQVSDLRDKVEGTALPGDQDMRPEEANRYGLRTRPWPGGFTDTQHT